MSVTTDPSADDEARRTGPLDPVPSLGVVDESVPSLRVVDESVPSLGVVNESDPSLGVSDEPDPSLGVVDDSDPSLGVFDESVPSLGVFDESVPSLGVFDEPNPSLGVANDSDPSPEVFDEPLVSPLVPGLAAVAAVVAVAFAAAGVVPAVSPLLFALGLGLLVAPLVRRTQHAEHGVAFAARSLLRAGVALLGLRIALGDLASLGVSGVVLAAGTLAVTFSFTVWLGRRLDVPRGATLLIAAGCSICGAAAIAAMRPATDADDQDAGRAVAAVGVLGTIAMLLVPVLGANVLGLSSGETGMWAGASIHEVAQVTAAGAAISVAALKTATLVKLVRVALLAPTVALAGRGSSAPPVPPFVLAFLALVLVRTVVPLPQELIDGAAVASLILLAAGMGGLGLQIRPRSLLAGGTRPLLLALAATACALATGVALVVALR